MVLNRVSSYIENSLAELNVKMKHGSFIYSSKNSIMSIDVYGKYVIGILKLPLDRKVSSIDILVQSEIYTDPLIGSWLIKKGSIYRKLAHYEEALSYLEKILGSTIIYYGVIGLDFICKQGFNCDYIETVKIYWSVDCFDDRSVATKYGFKERELYQYLRENIQLLHKIFSTSDKDTLEFEKTYRFGNTDNRCIFIYNTDKRSERSISYDIKNNKIIHSVGMKDEVSAKKVLYDLAVFRYPFSFLTIKSVSENRILYGLIKKGRPSLIVE